MYVWSLLFWLLILLFFIFSNLFPPLGCVHAASRRKHGGGADAGGGGGGCSHCGSQPREGGAGPGQPQGGGVLWWKGGWWYILMKRNVHFINYCLKRESYKGISKAILVFFSFSETDPTDWPFRTFSQQTMARLQKYIRLSEDFWLLFWYEQRSNLSVELILAQSVRLMKDGVG